MCLVRPHNYHSAAERDEDLVLATVWVDLEVSRLRPRIAGFHFYDMS